MSSGNYTDQSDELLLKNLISKSELAFKAIYNRHKGALYGYCRSLVKSDAYAEEIVQEVFIKLWTKADYINPNLPLQPYLYAMVRNHCFNFLKKAARTQALHKEVFYNRPTSENSLTDSLLEAEYEAVRKGAIETLPPKRKAIFLMSRKRNMSYSEIGQELGISISTVKTQMSLALSSIREYLRVNTDLHFSISWLLVIEHLL